MLCYDYLSTDVDVEPPSNLKMVEKLNTMKDRYKYSFTIHALNHIIEGNVTEKIVWSIKLMVALGLAVYLCWSLFIDYFNYKGRNFYIQC